MTSSIIQLECQCNNYPWGKKGKDSLAARYAAATPGAGDVARRERFTGHVSVATLTFFLCPFVDIPFPAIAWVVDNGN